MRLGTSVVADADDIYVAGPAALLAASRDVLAARFAAVGFRIVPERQNSGWQLTRLRRACRRPRGRQSPPTSRRLGARWLPCRVEAPALAPARGRPCLHRRRARGRHAGAGRGPEEGASGFLDAGAPYAEHPEAGVHQGTLDAPAKGVEGRGHVRGLRAPPGPAHGRCARGPTPRGGGPGASSSLCAPQKGARAMAHGAWSMALRRRLPCAADHFSSASGDAL